MKMKDNILDVSRTLVKDEVMHNCCFYFFSVNYLLWSQQHGIESEVKL